MAFRLSERNAWGHHASELTYVTRCVTLVTSDDQYASLRQENAPYPSSPRGLELLTATIRPARISTRESASADVSSLSWVT
jgi:hypothetical protein